MLRFFTSCLLLLCFFTARAQNDSLDLGARDSTSFGQRYGLRVGIDLSKPIRALFDSDYSGLEFVADYRITKKLYVAAEFGNEKKTSTESLENVDDIDRVVLYNYTTSGSYVKLGVDFNTYENWYGMTNAIIFGARFAGSSFSQTLNNYTIYDSNRYWNPNNFAPGSGSSEEFSGLTATWLEFLVGIKVELFANFYLSGSVRLSYLFTNKEADFFPNLWIPGFNKVNDNSKFGVGYNYTISYFIPLYRKKTNKKKKESPPEE
ncbi:DUF6048 family protein [uncultured Eudoraea sp.]|uniref:DUF6048 family protein n=1 Tax=uncultured Eudoraea sp. TaxID=1035614 RepID=UPI00260A9568|nr:DUF6048 family protein [uncultured Eudoraea sp.]